jgi:phosphatidylglycerophosphate synthase
MKLKYKLQFVISHKKKSTHKDWRSKLFLTPALFFTWIFLKLRISANTVSLISIFFPIIGSFFLASQNLKIIFIGSLGISIYFLLDYSDGALAKISKTSSINGIFLDLLMHPLAVVSTISGISIGAIYVTGPQIIPFAILTIIATLISNIKDSYVWFAICFFGFEKKNKNSYFYKKKIKKIDHSTNNIYRLLKNFCTILFHENYLIFTLPLVSLVNLVFNFPLDFRVAIVVVGAIIYFPVSVFGIIRIIKDNRVTNNYNKLFYSKSKTTTRSLTEQNIYD